MGSLILYSRTVPKYYGKLCSFELWKTTQIIHGNKEGCTPAGRITEQHDIFFELVLKEMIPK
jgi:hypothetical protein